MLWLQLFLVSEKRSHTLPYSQNLSPIAPDRSIVGEATPDSIATRAQLSMIMEVDGEGSSKSYFVLNSIFAEDDLSPDFRCEDDWPQDFSPARMHDSFESAVNSKYNSFRTRVLELLAKENPIRFDLLVPTTTSQRIDAAKAFNKLLRKLVLLYNIDVARYNSFWSIITDMAKYKDVKPEQGEDKILYIYRPSESESTLLDAEH